MSQADPPDDMDRLASFGPHPVDATIARIAKRLLVAPRDDAIWHEAAALNAAKHPLDAAHRRGEITVATYRERLRVVAGPVLAREDHTATEIFVAATLLLLTEAAANPRPDSLN
jgi:hypothetical protein